MSAVILPDASGAFEGWSLDSLRDEIKENYEESRQAAKNAMEKAMAAGELLHAAKATFRYGAVANSDRDLHPANGTPSRAYKKPAGVAGVNIHIRCRFLRKWIRDWMCVFLEGQKKTRRLGGLAG